MTRLLLALLLLLSPWLVHAHETERIAALYARGLTGDKQAVVDCIAALDQQLARKPDDQLARVYLGSAWTLRSRDLPFGPAKLSALRKGLALMDEAAKAAPDDLKVLLLRAVTNEALPRFLGRKRVAHQQLEELERRVAADAAKLDAADRQLLYLNAGQAASEAGETERARALWQRGLTIKADAKLKKEIQAALARE